MNGALSGPFLAAAGVLCVSGAAKLRSAAGAVAALRVLGLPGRAGAVRALAAGEIALGLAAAIAPGAATALGLAGAYVTFTVVAGRLAVLRAACGCFGEDGAPASPVQALLSATLAGVALAAAAWPPAGVAWLVHRPVPTTLTLALGIVAGVYGLVVAYTQLPAAWSAWSAS